MKTMSASHGLEWESDGSAYLDALPAPAGRPEPVTLEEALSAVTGYMEWYNAEDLEKSAFLPGFVGVIGYNKEAGILMRYMYKRGTHAVDGLYAIEERDVLPAAIATAVLTARTAQPLPTKATYATIAPGHMALMNDLSVQDAPGVPRLNSSQLDGYITRYIHDSMAGERCMAIPKGAVNAARFWLGLAAAAWKPETLRLLATVGNLSYLENLNELATRWIHIRQGFAFRIGKADIKPISTVNSASQWMEALDWTHHEIRSDAARFFGGFHATDETWWLMNHLPAVDEHHADAVAAGLIREARERRVYEAVGQFVLMLPPHLPWAQTPITALAIHAQAEGLWVAGLTAQNERTASWWWQPDMMTQTVRQQTMQAKPLVHATLAAFWHDLVVAGDEVFVTSGRQPRPFTQKDKPRVRGAGDPIVVLPRRMVHYSGRLEWSSPEDREIIVRRIHGVRGHLRILQEGWHRSEEAECEAREWGFVLPDGYTFVRPHVRGGHEDGPEPLVAKARGLQTLSTML